MAMLAECTMTNPASATAPCHSFCRTRRLDGDCSVALRPSKSGWIGVIDCFASTEERRFMCCFLRLHLMQLEASLKERDAAIQKQQQELAALTAEVGF